jgi:hypothetical protein
MKYLYTFAEGGDFRQSDREPSPDDLDAVDSGALTVVRFHEGSFQWINPVGVWETILEIPEPTPEDS